MSQSACSLSVAIDRAASSATGPQSRQLTFKPCRRLLGCHSLGSPLQKLNRQAIGALALALKICSVIGCPCFEPRDLRLQCLDLFRKQGDVVCLATTWWAGRMPYFSEINAYQGFAIIRK
jgi:hypothetical protein